MSLYIYIYIYIYIHIYIYIYTAVTREERLARFFFVFEFNRCKSLFRLWRDSCSTRILGGRDYARQAINTCAARRQRRRDAPIFPARPPQWYSCISKPTHLFETAAAGGGGRGHGGANEGVSSRLPRTVLPVHMHFRA